MDATTSARESFYEHLKEIESLYDVSGVRTLRGRTRRIWVPAPFQSVPTANAYASNPTESVAVNAYINAILSTDLRLSDSGAPARGMVLTAVVDLIKNLVLYGYSCFRMLSTEIPDDGNVPIQIPSGAAMPVRFSSKRLRWVPDFKSSRTGSGLEIFEPTPEGTESSDDEDEEEDDPFRWRVWSID